MSWLDVQMALLTASTTLVELALNWLLQSTLLIALGLLAGHWLRRRGSAVQSAVYRTTLAAVLLCPLVSGALGLAGVSGWSVTLSEPWTLARESAESAPTAPPPLEMPEQLAAQQIPPIAQRQQPNVTLEPDQLSAGPLPPRQLAPQDGAERIVEEPLSAIIAPPAESPVALSVHLSGWISLAICTLWLLLCARSMARLGGAWWQLLRLCGQAVPAEALTQQTCRELSALLGVRPPQVLRTPFLPSPCLAGVRRPVILLPNEDSGLSLRDVLVHELAHLVRRDCHWNLLRQLALALFFFQPLLWLLSRRLEAAAEEVCDDFVVQFGGDRHQYAHRLVDIAELSTAAVAPAGVGIVSFRSMLARRVHRILDTSRSLSTRVGNVLLVMVLVAGLLGTLIAGLVGIGPKHSVAQSPSAAREDGSSDAASRKGEPGKVAVGDTQGSKTDSAAPAQASAPAADRTITVRGRVLGPDGKPVAGASVHAAWMVSRQVQYPSSYLDYKIVAKDQSDNQGDFELTFSTNHPDPRRRALGWHVAAFAPGLAPAWQADVQVHNNVKAHQPTNLTLTAEHGIRGRVVDLEGNPVSGVHIRVHNLWRPESEQALLDWLKDAKEKSPPANVDGYYDNSFSASPATKSPHAGAYPVLWRDRFLAHGSPALPADTSTDNDGGFQLTGLGADQLAILEFESPRIAKCYAHVVVRDMAAVSAKPVESLGVRTGIYHGKDFRFVAEPTQPITGTVTDAESGQPLANVEVHVAQFAGSRFTQRDFLTTRTDQDGRYTLIGAPTGGGHRVEVAPSVDEPYFPTKKQLAKASGIDPISLDFTLRRGQWIVGKVTDRESGKPIGNVHVEYLPLRGNPFAKDYPNYRPELTGQMPVERYRSAADGSFRVLAIPGPGILAAIAHYDDRTLYASLRRELVPARLVKEDGYLDTYHPFSLIAYHALREIDLPKSAEDTTFDLQLTKGLKRTVNLLDPQGQPVKGIHVLSRNEPPSLEGPLDDSRVEVIGLQPNETREVIFIQMDRRIGKAVAITAGDELTVELEPCAVARGRVVDQDGQGVAELPINVWVARSKADTWSRPLVGTSTDKDGRFEALLPSGVTCRVWHYSKTGTNFSAECRARAGAIFELGDLTNETQLDTSQTENLLMKTAGEANELDNGTLGSDKSVVAEPAPPSQATVPAPQPPQATVAGRVTLPNGQPAASAQVTIVAMRAQQQRGGHLSNQGEVLAEGTTDASGAYHLTVVGVSSNSHRYANLLARKEGYGVAWKQIDLDAKMSDVSLDLSVEEPIRGRLVNIEGLPAGNVRLSVHSIMKPTTGDVPTRNAVGYTGQVIPQAWLQPVVSDDQGRFTLLGIPAGYGAFLTVQGDDRFAPQDIALNTGMSEQRGERDGTYRPLVANPKLGEEAVLPLSPAQIIEGTVTYQDTGEPAAGARLTIWASQQEPFGSMISVAGKADENGRYRISPRPGIRFGVNAYPPDGVPYMAHQTSPSDGIRWNAGDRVRRVDVTLRRGVLVRGTIVEAGTARPVAGASVQYEPESAHNPHADDSVLTGWQGIQLSDEQGKFEIVVPPGPGQLLVHGPLGKYVLREISERELSHGAKGGRRYYANAIERFDPAVGADPLEVRIPLEPSAAIHGKLVDEQGQPVDKVSIITRLFIMPHSPFWRGYGGDAPQPTARDAFEVSGLAPDQKCPVYFLNAERRLGATEVLRANMSDPTIVLKPCGQATARYIDTEGTPRPEIVPTMFIVVTPGTHKYDYEAAKLGKLAADEDFVANVDRRNHYPWPKTDEQGRITFSALIPGATYRLYGQQKGKSRMLKEFTVNAGEQRDLGDLTIDATD